MISRFLREYAYVIAGAVLAVPTFALSLLAIVFSAFSLLTVGLPFLVGVLWLARGSVRYFRGPARTLLGWDWPDPGPVRLLGLIRDPAGWKALAYGFLTFPIKLTAAYLGVALTVVGLCFATSPGGGSCRPTGSALFRPQNGDTPGRSASRACWPC